MSNNTITDVKKILWQVLFLNFMVAGLKIAVGLFGGILSMVADGFHSMVDGSSNIIGLVAMRVAQAPPDDTHPYGHRKAETLATMIIGIMLIVAAYEILRNAIERLTSGIVPDVTPLSFAVMIFTISVNLGVTIYESQRGKALHSEILLADAQHTRSDIWVSLSVIAGLIGVRLGLPWLDAGVGLVIAGVIGHAAYGILSDATNVLMDAAALPHDELETLVQSLPEVRGVERVRSRGQADNSYVDLHVQVDPHLSTDMAHSVAHAVQHRIRDTFPQVSEVMVHIEPAHAPHTEHPNVSRILQSIAQSLGGAVHEIWAHSINGQYFVEAHFEVPPTYSLTQAHDLAVELEQRGIAALPSVTEIITHLEPMGEAIAAAKHTDESQTDIIAHAQTIANNVCGADAAHRVRLWAEKNGWTISMHIRLPGDMSIIEAHAISQRVEEALRHEIENVQRVVIHADPMTNDQ